MRLRPNVIFQRNGNAMQSSAELPSAQLTIHITRGFQSLLASDGDEGVQGGIVSVDSMQTSLGELDRGYRFAAQQCRSRF
jgi:hypothetical protein